MIDKTLILSDLKKHLQSNLDKSVHDVILFGSFARGDANELSDFDVLIVLDKEYTGRDESKILDLCYDINLKYNIIIDAHIISKKELTSLRGKQPIFSNAIKSGLYA